MDAYNFDFSLSIFILEILLAKLPGTFRKRVNFRGLVVGSETSAEEQAQTQLSLVPFYQ